MKTPRPIPALKISALYRTLKEKKSGGADGNVISHSPEIGSSGHQEGGGVEILGVKHS